jgi:thiol-disulfide isomerase/thioredoxin
MKVIAILALWFFVGCLAAKSQTNPQAAFLEIRFEAPNLSYTPLVDWENYAQMERKTPIDSSGYLRVSVPITRSQMVYINYLDSSNTIYNHCFFLPKADTLKCQEKAGVFVFEGKSKAAQINRFLQQNGLFFNDTLQGKPLMRQTDDLTYASLMQSMADETWQRYQSTQDTTDNTQNVFVKAALEGQHYLRTKYFLLTKSWTEEMFKERKGRRNSLYMADFKPTHNSLFRIIEHEDAILSISYLGALTDYLGAGSLYINDTPQSQITEQLNQFYDEVNRRLPRLPKTRERLLAAILHVGINSQALLERFEQDFPASPYLKNLKYAQWQSEKIQSGTTLPPVSIITQDSTSTNLSSVSLGGTTLILFWNTWEDSCQTALTSMAKLSLKYAKSRTKIRTICLRNRFDSWKEVLPKCWQSPKKEAHFYANYPETEVLEGIFGKTRPAIIVIDGQGKFIEQFSAFDTEKTENWLKK